MIEGVAEVLLALAELGGELLVEGFVAAVDAHLSRRLESGDARAHTSRVARGSWARWLLYAGIGAALGAASLLLWPDRLGAFPLIVRATLPLLGAMVSGFAMRALGAWRVRSGRTTTALATFGGGALFALSFAVARAVGHAL